MLNMNKKEFYLLEDVLDVKIQKNRMFVDFWVFIVEWVIQQYGMTAVTE